MLFFQQHAERRQRKEYQSEIIQAFIEKPKYDCRSRGPKKETEAVKTVIEECLKLNEDRRAMGLHKQQMKKIDIHEHLIKKGFEISYSTVKRLTRKLESRHQEAFIRQKYNPGDICEYDWGTVKLDIGGAGHLKYQMAVFAPSTVTIINHCHGVFHIMVYDNMRVAVR